MTLHYEPGRYRLKIVGADLGEAENGTPHIELYLEVLGRYEGQQLQAVTGPGRTAFLSITDVTIGTLNNPGWVAQTLTDLGFDWSFGRFDHYPAYQRLLGQERDGECKHEEWNGEYREKWGVYRNSRSPLKPASAETGKALNAKFGPLMKQLAKRTGSAPPAPQRPANGRAPARPLQPPPQAEAEPLYVPPDQPGPNTSGDIPF